MILNASKATMVDGAGPKIGDARSLWNFTPSPGWTKDEAYALRQLLKKFGIGKWVQIVDSGVLPGKQIQQLNGQTQRLLGKQSLAEYSGMRLDVDRIRMDNDALENVIRKNGLITNQGGIRSKEALAALRAENLKKYGLSDEEVAAIELPTPPRAAGLGAEIYMGKNHNRGGVGGSDVVTTTTQLDVMKSDVDALSAREQRALVKALMARVQGLLTECLEDDVENRAPASNEPAEAAATEKPKKPAAKRAKKPAAKRATKKSKRGGSDDEDDGAYETVDVAQDDGPVAMLMNMGFAKQHCLAAIAACGGDTEECVEWLMTNVA